ncbi:MAG: n-acetylglutamate synthase [Acidobacteriota bacterium]|nr:n-acetylglutamate synthase [Acidobacteriota bacterium]
MPAPTYDGRRFRVVANTDNGDSGPGTVFHYRQHGDTVWATYEGGDVAFGTLLARVHSHGGLSMRYQHLNSKGEFCCGRCESELEVLPDGRYRLNERWQWTEPLTSSGQSVIEEIPSSSSP